MTSDTLAPVALSNHGPHLSPIVAGAWRMGEWGMNVEQRVRWIEQCLDLGITSFDHADIYGGYTVETLFGEALAAQPSLRSRMQLVTKCGIKLVSERRPGHAIKSYDTSRAHVLASVDESLRAMHTDHIDLLLIHRPDPLMDHHALGACLDSLIQSGKVRAAGVSNFMPWDVDLLQSRMKHKLQTNQLELSLLNTAPFINGQLAHAQQHGMPVMAWSPLGGGRLHAQASTPGTAAARLAPKLAALAQAAGTDTTAVAMAWLMHHPVQVLPVMGSNQLERIAVFADAARVPMDRQTWYELYELANGHEVP